MSLIHLFKKMKHWNLGIIGYWVYNWDRLLNWKRTWSLVFGTSLPNCSKDYWKVLYFFMPINWPSLVTLWFVVQKIYSKMHLVSCTNTHHDITDLVNHGMVKNTKTWIYWEWKITSLRNEKLLNLCLRWYDLIKSENLFVGEVTFKKNKKKILMIVLNWISFLVKKYEWSRHCL